MRLKAYGEAEQSYWLREVAQAHTLSVGDSADFFDYFTLTVDAIYRDAARHSADITISSTETGSLLAGSLTYHQVKAAAPSTAATLRNSGRLMRTGPMLK